MKKIWLLIIVIVILSFFLPLSPLYSQVKEPGLITLGKYQIGYDEFFKDDTNEDGIVDKVSYFHDNNLVLTIWDENQDGLPDTWFFYDEDEYLMLIAEDLNSDGKPDEFSHFNREEQVVKKEKVEKTTRQPPVENPFSKEKPDKESILQDRNTAIEVFRSDHGNLSLAIREINLESKDSGELAWILELIMQVETDLELYSTEYWFIYPDCPQEDVYACGDSTGITYDYINNPARNYEKIFPEYQEKYYDAGQSASRRFTLPLCMEAYQQYGTTRVNLVQAVEYYLDSEGRVETLEWEFYSP